MKEKKLRVITEILAIIVICLISFVGVYRQNTNKMENQVKGYDLSKDLSGYREVRFQISDATEVLDKDGKVVGSTDDYSDNTIQNYSYTKTDTKINSDEVYTKENYQKCKLMIEQRLRKLGVTQYNISLDEQTGTIYVQIPEDDDTDHTISNILQVANFEIKDSEDDSKVFLTNKDIKNVAAVYNTSTSGTTVYLQLEFNKNGTQILKELSTGEYVKKEDTSYVTDADSMESTEDENAVEAEANVSTTENNQDENSDDAEEKSNEESEESEDDQKQITLSIDNNEMITTSFETPIEDGIIDLSMSKETTDQESIAQSLKSVSTIALLLNSGKMPITYKVETNQYVDTDIQEKTVNYVLYIIGGVIIIALVYLIIKFKTRGLLAAIAYIGFVAVYLLLIRYTNVQTSIESIVSGTIIAIINYILTYRLIKISDKDEERNKKIYPNEFKSSILALLPVFIIAIIFSFIKWTQLSTFGMFLFWGVLLSMIYNYMVTKDMIN